MIVEGKEAARASNDIDKDTNVTRLGRQGRKDLDCFTTFQSPFRFTLGIISGIFRFMDYYVLTRNTPNDALSPKFRGTEA